MALKQKMAALSIYQNTILKNTMAVSKIFLKNIYQNEFEAKV